MERILDSQSRVSDKDASELALKAIWVLVYPDSEDFFGQAWDSSILVVFASLSYTKYGI